MTGVEQIARSRRVTHVVLPHRELTGVRRLVERPLADQLLERLPELELHVVGAKPDPSSDGKRPRGAGA